MNNEHYCLVWEDAYGKLKVVDICPPPEGSIKLYTHPAKSLTDEEIWEAIEKHMGRNFLGRCYRQSQFELSKAILREAQGK